MKGDGVRRKVLVLAKRGVFPTFFYFVSFVVLTWPAVPFFSTHFLTDNGDGLQNVWNIWWMNKALLELGQSPWYTPYLHQPSGVTLLGHTLQPLNGFMGILLLRFLTLVEVYNSGVVFSFVMGGLTAFLLALYLSKSYWGSIVAGFVFAFSPYQFAKTWGLLLQLSLEWIPLFVLSWCALLARPRIALALASALAFFLIALSHYYYAFYGVLAAAIVFFWHALRTRDALFFIRKPYPTALLVFFVVALLTTGPLVVLPLLSNMQDPFVGAHATNEFSLDLLAPFIPGGHWRFASLTQFYWSALPGNAQESDVHLGLPVVGILAYVWIKRRHLQAQGIGLW